METQTLFEQLQGLWPFFAGAGGLAYWFITQFNSIKSNDARLHAEVIVRIADTNAKLLGGQEIMSRFGKELSAIQNDLVKLSESIGRDNKEQADKFIRIDDKISHLQGDMGKAMSDTLIHLQHLGKL